MRILLIKLRHYGDVLLITPVINSLKQNYADASIDILLYEETREILLANSSIDQIYTVDRRWKHQGIYRHGYYYQQLLSSLRQRRYQLVLNLSDQWHSAFISAFTGAKTRIAFDLAKRRHWLWRRCHTRLVSRQTQPEQHIVEQNLSILTPLALPALCQQVTMSYQPQHWQACRCYLPAHWQENYLVLHPVARWRFKSYPERQVCELVHGLSGMGYQLVLTGSNNPQELATIAAIQRHCAAGAVLSLAGQLTLCQLAALIDHARLVISVDSAPMHMAAALQTPLVALFGASKRQVWHPWQAADELIWAGDYAPLPDPDTVDTQTSDCYLAAIPTEAIIQAALRMLA